MKKPSRIVPGQEEEQFEAELLQALLLKQWIIPQTAAEVEVAERVMEQEGFMLPSILTDPLALLSGAFRHLSIRESQSFQNEQIEQNLAWAARNGKEISSDIWERMQSDRVLAEAKYNNER